VEARAKDLLGRRGEDLAAAYLIERGFRILERNWRCARGEIDLIAREGDETVFVEVKTRSSLAYGHPLEAITIVKLARLRRLAATWCAEHEPRAGSIRIDAVAIVAPAGKPPEIEHLRGVFR
jgi:putative endonuclease